MDPSEQAAQKAKELERIMKSIRLALVGTMLAAGCASVPAADNKPEASIPFVNQGASIHAWQADGKTGIWIQDERRDWYYASLQAPCTGLEFAPRLAFEPRTTSALDRFGSISVPGYGRCSILSLTKSDAPPSDKVKKEKAESAKTK
jgi:hypothetical protein